MDRLDILQKIVDVKKFSSYLEIGAASGEVFLHLKNLKQKIAIDPNFLYPMSLFKNSTKRSKEQYYEMTSDEYFDAYKPENIDLVFIDGLHKCKQIEKDICNCKSIMNKNGIIVLHDCNPPHKAAAIPAGSYKEATDQAVRGWTGEWCGDVWKVCFIFPELVTLNTDYGVGLLRVKDIVLKDYNTDNIEKFTYDDLERDRRKILRLMPESYLDEFLR